MSDITISAKDVAQLRQETGAGMMDCKQALQESGGDKDKAMDYLRKKGKMVAAKRADRSANEGIIHISKSEDGRTAAMVEVNSETDFVAKNETFREFVRDVATAILEWEDKDSGSVDRLKELTFPSGAAIGDVLTDLTGRIGEKLDIRRFSGIHTDTGYIGSYTHADSKLGVLVLLEGVESASPEVHELGRDLAMQIAAAAPIYVRREEVPADKREAELEIQIERAREEGKPEKALDKIAQGRLNKWLSEIVLMEQPFIKEQKVTISKLVQEVSKKANTDIEVVSFVRYRVGA